MSDRKDAVSLFRKTLLDIFDGKYNDMSEEEKERRSREIVLAYLGIDESSESEEE